jgi:hypothetical protein
MYYFIVIIEMGLLRLWIQFDEVNSPFITIILDISGKVDTLQVPYYILLISTCSN